MAIWVPSVATILAAIISAYATFSANEASHRASDAKTKADKVTINVKKVTSAVSNVSSEIGNIKKTDIGTLEHGQKLCVVAQTKVWHNITVVSKEWTASMCAELGKPFSGDAFYLGCAFPDGNVFSAVNVLVPPAKNCGW